MRVWKPFVVAARNKEKSDAAVAELRGIGARTVFVSVDVEKENSCRALIASTVEEFGQVNILVNNAGISLPSWSVGRCCSSGYHVVAFGMSNSR
jgi:2-dehydro-3-deoxy-D-gluconate 5-dehydrogenase